MNGAVDHLLVEKQSMYVCGMGHQRCCLHTSGGLMYKDISINVSINWLRINGLASSS